MISQWATENHILGGSFSGIGSATHINLASWDANQKTYTTKALNDPSYEITNIEGNLAWAPGDSSKGEATEVPSLHVHTSIADANKNLFGGHVAGDFQVPAVLELTFLPSLEKMVRGVSAGTGGSALDP
jgi:predicted DNA-binding protein with PD1-like motif